MRFTRRRGWGPWVVAATLTVMTFAALAALGGTPQGGTAVTAKQPGAAEVKLSSKEEAFVAKLLAAGSLDEADRALKEAKLSSAEVARIQAKLGGDEYAAKLAGLQRQSEASFAKTKPISSTGARAQADQKERSFLQRRQADLTRLNTAARTLFAAKALPAGGPTAKPVVRSTQRKAGPALAANLNRPESAARIHSLEPPSLVVGGSFSINGEGFGPRGRVVLVIGDDLIELRVTRWGASQIEAEIPGLAAAPVGEQARNGIVWVKLAGGEIGPTREASISPDPARLIPHVTHVSQSYIEPGMQVVVTGSNFLSRRGTVVFQFGGAGPRYDGVVADWDDTAILLEMPSQIAGLRRQRCRVTLTNTAGNTAFFDTDFQPTQEVRTLNATHHVAAVLIFGFRRHATDFDFPLLNDWAVDEAWLTKDGSGHYGTSFTGGGRPEPGSNSPRTRIEYWCDGYAWVWAFVHVRIVGPKGVPYE
jgi:hypothetical protein